MRLFRLTSPAVVVFTATGMFIHPPPAPVDRLLANENHIVKTHPDDPVGYYTLGRIHYLAFSLGTKRLSVSKNDRTGVEVDGSYPGRQTWDPKEPTGGAKAKWTAHVHEAVRQIKKAIELDPGNALYELGLACVFEDGKSAASDSWQEDAIHHYLAAYSLAEGEDRKAASVPIEGLSSLISYEAGESYVRVVRARGVRDSEITGLKKIEARIHEMQHLPPGTVTPVVFSLTPGRHVADLLSSKQVPFDLDGAGRPQRYQWLRPDAALLVWNPKRSGRIASGHDLFGSVTWWIFWRSGYQALAALDDDHDGWLKGGELSGLALWSIATATG